MIDMRELIARLGAAFIILGMLTATYGAPPPAHSGELVQTAPSTSPSDAPASPPASPSGAPTSAPADGPTSAPAASNDAASPSAAPIEHLSDLVATAKGDLKVRFVGPGPNSASPIGATPVVVGTVPGALVELRVNGELVDKTHLGKLVVDGNTKEAQFFYYGVPLQAGPNTLVAVSLGADGARSASASEIVYGPDQASSIRVEAVQHLIADGVSTVPVNVFVTDRFGHPAAPSERVRVTILSGDIHFAELAHATPPPGPNPGATPDDPPTSQSQSEKVLELPLPPGGYVPIHLQPGTLAGNVELEVHVGSAYVRRALYVEPFVRAAIVNGIVEGGIGSVPSAIDGDGRADGGGARRGRVALYASGALGRSLVTVVYESQNRLSPVSSFGAFQDDPNARPYLTYGDASQVVAPYHSADHLYARVDRGRSYAAWGQFNAHVGPTDVGGYARQLSGASGTLALGQSGRATISGFTARDDQAFVSRLLPISGLASLTQALDPDIVVGSDQLTLVTLDRKTGLALNETTLLRNVDYTIDYATGLLRFINIPLPFDAAFNPNLLSLHYEHYGPQVKSRTSAGQVAYVLSRDGRSSALASYVNDATGASSISIAAQSFERRWEGGSFTVSHAVSQGAPQNFGNALQIGTTLAPAAGSALALAFAERLPLDAIGFAYQTTTAGYSDPFGGFSSPGISAYRANWTHGILAKGQFAITYSGARNAGIGTPSTENDLSAHYVRPLGRHLTATLGLTHHDQHIGQASAAAGIVTPLVPLATVGQTQAEAALAYRSLRRISASIEELLTLGGSDVGSTQPSQTVAQINYDLPKRGRFFVRELISAQPSSTFANSTSNLGIGGTSTRSTQIGFEEAVSTATTISSQYVINQTGSGLNIYDALGVDEHLKISKRLTAAAQLQAANAAGSGAQGFTLGALQLNYAEPSNALRTTFGYQVRTGAASGSTFNLGAAGHLSPNLGIAAFIQRAYGNGLSAVNDRISLAYRPLGDDRFISLFGYTRTNGSSLSGSSAGVYSLEELFRPRERTEIAARFVRKDDRAAGSPLESTLAALRVRQTLGSRSDLGVEFRQLSVPAAAGARATSVAIESGYALAPTIRLAAGYNVSGAVDATLLDQPLHKGFYFTVTSVISHLFGWGK